MTTRKLTIFQKNSNKVIVLTDRATESIQDLETNIKNVFGTGGIFEIKTEKETLIFRSSELAGMLIQTKGEPISQDEVVVTNKDASAENTSNYDVELVIEDD